MAFGGTATKRLMGKQMCRVTGVSLAASAEGTISESDGDGDVKLSSDFEGINQDTVVIINNNESHVSVAYADNELTFTNTDDSNASGTLDIVIMTPNSIIK